MPLKGSKEDKRNYTFMIVPHFEKQIISYGVPAKTLKYVSICLILGILIAVGSVAGYAIQIKTSISQERELAELRESNSKKDMQIEELAQNMAALQNSMNQINQMDKEVREILAGIETAKPLEDDLKSSNIEYTSKGGPVLKPTAENVGALMKELEAKMSNQHERLINLKENAKQVAQLASATPSIWPTAGEVTSSFGWRNSPWGYGGDWHPGIDIANDYGTPVVATANGIVVESAYVSGYGNLIVIDHGNGIETAYGHNAELLVKEGQAVQKGQIIAHMGSTGLSTGPHVHYEVRKNKVAVNPNNFL